VLSLAIEIAYQILVSNQIVNFVVEIKLVEMKLGAWAILLVKSRG
jgi:hypothetical protein